MLNIILIIILSLIIISAVLILRRSKKKGNQCIGCPYSGNCSGKCEKN